MQKRVNMKAFHGDPKIKEKFVQNAIWHREQDRYVQGKGDYKSEKGCMIACSFKTYDHALAPKEAGCPEWLARVADKIFEGLSKEDSDYWTERFWGAINPGADLEKIKAPFLIFVMESTLDKFDHKKYPKVKESIESVIELYRSGETDIEKFRKARKAAADAAAYAADAAAYAADAAAYAAAYAADAAAYAAYAAAAADAADAAAYAAAARTRQYKKFADKLIELLQAEK